MQDQESVQGLEYECKYGDMFCPICGAKIENNFKLREHLEEHGFFKGGAENIGGFIFFAKVILMFNGIRVKGKIWKLVSVKFTKNSAWERVTFENEDGKRISFAYNPPFGSDAVQLKKWLYHKIYNNARRMIEEVE